MICAECLWNETRGGVILPREPFCAAADSAGFTDRQASFLSLTLRHAAATAGDCPHYQPFPAAPDAYHSIDLEIKA